MSENGVCMEGSERTPQEIMERVESIDDPLGFKTGVLVYHLPYEHAHGYLKDDVTEEGWEETRNNVDPPEEAARDYLSFAWEKANNQHGISSNRSVDKIEEWLWLAGMGGALSEFQSAPYPDYGKPKLEVAGRYLHADSNQ